MVKMTDQVRLAKIGWFDSLWCVHVYIYDIYIYVYIYIIIINNNIIIIITRE